MMIMTFAMGMGNALDKLGVLSNLIGGLIKKINSVLKLVGVTMLISYISGAIGCTMSMSHVVTGKVMAPVYREKGVDPHVLSRTMEDCGTLGGCLMPWHTNAVYFTGTLGVLYIEYLPWVLLSYIVPILSLVAAAIGFGIWYVDPKVESVFPRRKPPSIRSNPYLRAMICDSFWPGIVMVIVPCAIFPIYFLQEPVFVAEQGGLVRDFSAGQGKFYRNIGCVLRKCNVARLGKTRSHSV